MDEVEELANKVTLKQLRETAKQHGISTCKKKKIDIARELPIEVLRKLAEESNKK